MPQNEPDPNRMVEWARVNEGWICPKCWCVYGPMVEECRNCNSKLAFDEPATSNATQPPVMHS